MADPRKAKLKRLQKKLNKLSENHPEINLNDLKLYKDINEFRELTQMAFFLKFDIEHCSECGMLLPKYRNKLDKSTNE